MLQLMLEKAKKGTIITVSSDSFEDAQRAYRSFLRASIKLDRCTKTTWQGQTSSGWSAYVIEVPGLPYVVACERIAKLWPEAERSYPQLLIGG